MMFVFEAYLYTKIYVNARHMTSSTDRGGDGILSTAKTRKQTKANIILVNLVL